MLKNNAAQAFLKSLFATIFLSVAITELRYSLLQCLLISSIYLLCFFINRIVFRANLISRTHSQNDDTPKSQLYFRGETYEAMGEIEKEKSYLIVAGDYVRVNRRRWATRFIFVGLSILFYKAHYAGRLVTTAAGFTHLVTAATFLPMESLSHTFLPLGINAILICVSFAFGSVGWWAIPYGVLLFLTLGFYALYMREAPAQKLKSRVFNSLQLAAVWLAMATALYFLFPNVDIKEKLQQGLEKTSEVVNKNVLPAAAQYAQKAGIKASSSSNSREASLSSQSSPNTPNSNGTGLLMGRQTGEANIEDIMKMRKAVADQLGQWSRLNGSSGGTENTGPSPSGGYNELNQKELKPEEISQQLDSLKKQMEQIAKTPPQNLKPEQVRELKSMEGKLAQLEQQSRQLANAQAAQKETIPQQPGSTAANHTGSNTMGNTTSPAKGTSQAALEDKELEELYKFKPPNLDRWWPLLKFLLFLSAAWMVYSILKPFFKMNRVEKTQETTGSIKNRKELEAIVKKANSAAFASTKEEVIYKYHAFMKTMEFFNRPRPEGLPTEDYGRWLSGQFPAQAVPIHDITYVFSDVLYGEKTPNTEEMQNFRQRFSEVVRIINT